MFTQVLQFLRAYWPALAVGSLVFRALYRRYLHPLSAIPGPFLASVTGLWWLAVYLGDKEQHRRPAKLHAQYGPVVRIRPNTVLINDPDSFAQHFSWGKSKFFEIFRGRPDIVPHGNEMDVKLHTAKKSNLIGAFTMTSVLKNESNLDKGVMQFIDRIGEKCGKVFDLAPWSQFATFDLATQMLFSEPIGFIREGHDIDGIIASLHNLFTVAGVLGLYPWIARLILNPWLFPILGPKPTDRTGPGWFQGFGRRQVEKRVAKKDAGFKHPDILQWILEHEDKNGEHMSNAMLEQESVGIITAASDTTAGTLRTLILALGSNSRILTKFRGQIDEADAKGLLSTPPTFEQVLNHVPYMEILFKEAQRFAPIVGIPLSRSVPESGAHISGHFLAGGTEVGLSQWAVGYNPNIYGQDVMLFKPERWSEDLSHDPVAQKRRVNAEVWFSGGHTLCTGRNLAMAEVYKIITQFFRVYDVEIANAAVPWKVIPEIAIVHTDFFVKLTERKKVNGEIEA